MPSLAIHGGDPALSQVGPVPTWPQPHPEDEAALRDVLWSGKWGSTHGEMSRTFAGEFAEYQQAAHGITVANGTVGLVAALRACGIGVGDEVIVPSYTFIATASAALFVGAVPVMADIDPATHLLTPDAVEAAITERTRAVIPVHLAGRPMDLAPLQELAHRHGLRVIEDCAQAIGASYQGRPVGTNGDLGVFSFQSSKNMTAGEGGVVVTDDEALANALYSAVNVGRVRGGGWYEHRAIGYNLRMTEFQSALLREQLRRHPADQDVRSANARILRDDLCAGGDRILLPTADPAISRHGHHLFLFRLPRLGADGLRDTAVEALHAEGVEASAGYVPLHRNEALVEESRRLTERLGQPLPQPPCPNTELDATDTVWLPQTMLLGSEEQTHAIAQAILKVSGAIEELRAIADANEGVRQ
jgi:dTDP-4-amino-4,6-dideoxygalactose transaminase